MNYIAGGVGRVIMLRGNKIIGVANTLTDNTFDFTITSDDIRGGRKNMLLGQYFHDSALAINLTNALFNFDEVAWSLGLDPNNEGGLSMYEEQVTAGSGSLTITETPSLLYGKKFAWYKKPSETVWTVGDVSDKNIAVPGAMSGNIYCVKYFWINPNARSINLRADYEPKEMHLVIIQDLFTAEQANGETTPGDKAGALITDIPRFKPSGNQNLGFTAGSTATTSLSGNALAVVDTSKCGETYSYGTMTEEIYNVKWQDRVASIAIENAEVELDQLGTETLAVRVLFKDGSASQRRDNKDFTFKVESDPASTANGTNVGKNTGIVTAGSSNGAAVISVKLTGYEASVEPGYAHVTVAS